MFTWSLLGVNSSLGLLCSLTKTWLSEAWTAIMVLWDRKLFLTSSHPSYPLVHSSQSLLYSQKRFHILCLSSGSRWSWLSIILTLQTAPEIKTNSKLCHLCCPRKPNASSVIDLVAAAGRGCRQTTNEVIFLNVNCKHDSGCPLSDPPQPPCFPACCRDLPSRCISPWLQGNLWSSLSDILGSQSLVC